MFDAKILLLETDTKLSIHHISSFFFFKYYYLIKLSDYLLAGAIIH